MREYSPALVRDGREDLLLLPREALLDIVESRYHSINWRIAAAELLVDSAYFDSELAADNFAAIFADVEMYAMHNKQPALVSIALEAQDVAHQALSEIRHARSWSFSSNYPAGGWIRGL